MPITTRWCEEEATTSAGSHTLANQASNQVSFAQKRRVLASAGNSRLEVTERCEWNRNKCNSLPPGCNEKIVTPVGSRGRGLVCRGDPSPSKMSPIICPRDHFGIGARFGRCKWNRHRCGIFFVPGLQSGVRFKSPGQRAKG